MLFGEFSRWKSLQALQSESCVNLLYERDRVVICSIHLMRWLDRLLHWRLVEMSRVLHLILGGGSLIVRMMRRIGNWVLRLILCVVNLVIVMIWSVSSLVIFILCENNLRLTLIVVDGWLLLHHGWLILLCSLHWGVLWLIHLDRHIRWLLLLWYVYTACHGLLRRIHHKRLLLSHHHRLLLLVCHHLVLCQKCTLVNLIFLLCADTTRFTVILVLFIFLQALLKAVSLFFAKSWLIKTEVEVSYSLHSGIYVEDNCRDHANFVTHDRPIAVDVPFGHHVVHGVNTFTVVLVMHKDLELVNHKE